MNAHRILEVGSSGAPQTLFHGVHGSRMLPLDTWIRAEEDIVYDGSDGTRYRSGFHVFPRREIGVKYLKRFQKERPLVICQVQVDEDELWEKEHSPAPVLLSRWMRIRPRDWKDASNPIDHPTSVPSSKRQEMQQFA